MRSLLALGILACIVVPASALAADSAPRVLRALVFDVTYAAHSNHEKKTSGFNGAYAAGAPSGGSPGVSGSGTAAVGLDATDQGRLLVNVIAATADGGLVIDTNYAGKLSNQGWVRVALFTDGRVSADPAKTLDPSVAHVLPLLARSFIANRDVNPGSSWTISAPPPARGQTTYRVTALDGQNATLAVNGSLSVSGVSGFDEVDLGTATYATDMIVPLSLDLNSRIHRQIAIDESVTTTAHLVVTLVSDSFPKK